MVRSISTVRTGAAFAAFALLALVRCASADHSVPFKGSADAVVTSVEVHDDGLHLTTSGSGQATHLGRYTREESIVINGVAITGTITFTAANGDHVSAAVEGTLTGPGAIGTYTITGGTGRFAHATGSADFQLVTADGIHLEVDFDGSIAY